MEIVIEQNVPLPKTERSIASILDDLQIGESFCFPRKRRVSIASTISNDFHAMTNKRFRVSAKDQPEGMMRVWRLEDKVTEEEVTNEE